MNAVQVMEWLFGCPWDEGAEKSIRDRKISAENARYGQLTSIAYEETLKGMADISNKRLEEGTIGSMSVEIADALMVKLAVLGIDRDREIAKINEEYESKRKEMLVKSKWLLSRLWHEWRSK